MSLDKILKAVKSNKFTFPKPPESSLSGRLKPVIGNKFVKPVEKVAFKEEGLYAFPEYKRVQKKYNGGDLVDNFQWKAYKRALERAKFHYEASRI